MKKPNYNSRNENLSGQAVLWDASTGDTLLIKAETYTVKDSYPNGVRLERETPYGVETIERGFSELKAMQAVYA